MSVDPVDNVVDAMPGALPDIAERTGYPYGQILRLITLARRRGIRIQATMQPPDPDHVPTTLFHVLTPLAAPPTPVDKGE